ncbi:MAG: prepilin-type N-terminal cleavage/methylation domain-containing protein [Nitrospiraceae bacterium]|nr:MAG: prepilin-type N-terminal cleavage/methylation domain-containing protein [Nitrospiraceae bacterium]
MTLNKLSHCRGLTLVEVLISLVIILIVFMGLIQSALVSIDHNFINELRDEAVRIASALHVETRVTAFDTLVEGTTNQIVTRTFRNISRNFKIIRTIADLDNNNKQITITVTWEWRDRNEASGTEYDHTINSILRR